jgi:hypothetical protein
MKGGDDMGVTILPTFKGYTVDLKLKEFRKAIPDVVLEFIPFDSPEGKKLLAEMKEFARKILMIESDQP